MHDPVQGHMLLVQGLMFTVQFVGLIGLALYTWESHKTRKASQDQVRVSQGLIAAAMDQVEGLSKPCLTLWSGLRDGTDAILETAGAVGNTVARGDEGNFVLQNIGNGIALNVSYRFVQTPQTETNRQHQKRYTQNVLAAQKVRMVEPMNPYGGGPWEVHFEYSSIGQREYESVVTINNFVLTAFVFGPTAESTIADQRCE